MEEALWAVEPSLPRGIDAAASNGGSKPIALARRCRSQQDKRLTLRFLETKPPSLHAPCIPVRMVGVLTLPPLFFGMSIEYVGALKRGSKDPGPQKLKQFSKGFGLSQRLMSLSQTR